VGRVIDDQVEWCVAEFVIDDRREALAVRLVDP
jgi:hypothetical protein